MVRARLATAFVVGAGCFLSSTVSSVEVRMLHAADDHPMFHGPQSQIGGYQLRMLFGQTDDVTALQKYELPEPEFRRRLQGAAPTPLSDRSEGEKTKFLLHITGVTWDEMMVTTWPDSTSRFPVYEKWGSQFSGDVTIDGVGSYSTGDLAQTDNTFPTQLQVREFERQGIRDRDNAWLNAETNADGSAASAPVVQVQDGSEKYPNDQGVFAAIYDNGVDRVLTYRQTMAGGTADLSDFVHLLHLNENVYVNAHTYMTETWQRFVGPLTSDMTTRLANSLSSADKGNRLTLRILSQMLWGMNRGKQIKQLLKNGGQTFGARNAADYVMHMYWTYLKMVARTALGVTDDSELAANTAPRDAGGKGKVWITGNSLGAMRSQLAAMWLDAQGADVEARVFAGMGTGCSVRKTFALDSTVANDFGTIKDYYPNIINYKHVLDFTVTNVDHTVGKTCYFGVQEIQAQQASNQFNADGSMVHWACEPTIGASGARLFSGLHQPEGKNAEYCRYMTHLTQSHEKYLLTLGELDDATGETASGCWTPENEHEAWTAAGIPREKWTPDQCMDACIYSPTCYSDAFPEALTDLKNNIAGLIDQPWDPKVLFGPIIGKITDTTARVMAEFEYASQQTVELIEKNPSRKRRLEAHTVSQTLLVEARKPVVFKFDNLNPDTEYEVRVAAASAAALGFASSLKTFAAGGGPVSGKLKFAATSAMRALGMMKDTSGQAAAQWADLATKAASHQIHVLIHMGDNVDQDTPAGAGDTAAMAAAGADSLANPSRFDTAKQILMQLPAWQYNNARPAIKEMFRQTFRDTYANLDTNTRTAMANTMNVMMINERDIRRGFGQEYSDDPTEAAAEAAAEQYAYDVALEYQHQLQEDIPAEGLATDSVLPYFSQKFGDTALVFVDTAVEVAMNAQRSAQQAPVLGLRQKAWLEDQFANQLDAMKSVVVVSPDPAVMLGGGMNQRLKALASKFAMNLDDPANAVDGEFLVNQLMQFQATSKQVLLVSGGSRMSGFSKIVDAAKGDFLMQVSASGIANPMSGTDFGTMRDIMGLGAIFNRGLALANSFRVQHTAYTNAYSTLIADIDTDVSVPTIDLTIPQPEGIDDLIATASIALENVYTHTDHPCLAGTTQEKAIRGQVVQNLNIADGVVTYCYPINYYSGVTWRMKVQSATVSLLEFEVVYKAFTLLPLQTWSGSAEVTLDQAANLINILPVCSMCGYIPASLTSFDIVGGQAEILPEVVKTATSMNILLTTTTLPADPICLEDAEQCFTYSADEEVPEPGSTSRLLRESRNLRKLQSNTNAGVTVFNVGLKTSDDTEPQEFPAVVVQDSAKGFQAPETVGFRRYYVNPDDVPRKDGGVEIGIVLLAVFGSLLGLSLVGAGYLYSTGKGPFARLDDSEISPAGGKIMDKFQLNAKEMRALKSAALARI